VGNLICNVQKIVIEPQDLIAAVDRNPKLKELFGSVLFAGADSKTSWSWGFCFNSMKLLPGVKEMLQTITHNFVVVLIKNTVPFLVAHQVCCRCVAVD
jgi:hypothetical protein